MAGGAKSTQNGRQVLLRGINRVTAKGVTYVYHRKTGIRLPDLPYSSPRFLAALRKANAAAATQSEAVMRFGLAENIPEIEIDQFRPPHQPDAIAYSLPQCVIFVHKAKPAQILHYHPGDLATDAKEHLGTRDKQRYIRLAAEFGAISLRQSRVDAGLSHYYALRTAEPIIGMPRHILQGDITPDEYLALHAINERQASISVARCIRDEIGTTDNEAFAVRDGMIRKGWLTNGRPPELTPLGLPLLE